MVAVADQVNKEVFSKLLAASGGHQTGLGLVGVDVDDRDLKALLPPTKRHMRVWMTPEPSL